MNKFRTRAKTTSSTNRGTKKFSIDNQAFDLRPPPVHLVNFYQPPTNFKPQLNARNARITKKSPKKLRQQPTRSMDVQVVNAVQQPNNKFVIEKFVYVPSQELDELKAAASIAVPRIGRIPKKKLKKLQNIVEFDDDEERVKVESVGMSSADQPIPDYSGFFPPAIFKSQENESTLILEPNSKAVSGNSGTSISSPLSRAILRIGVPVKVLYRPQSVAITGANGVAHAQSDLLLDFIDDDQPVKK